MQDAMGIAAIPTHSPCERAAQTHRTEPHAIYGKVTEPEPAGVNQV